MDIHIIFYSCLACVALSISQIEKWLQLKYFLPLFVFVFLFIFSYNLQNRNRRQNYVDKKRFYDGGAIFCLLALTL